SGVRGLVALDSRGSRLQNRTALGSGWKARATKIANRRAGHGSARVHGMDLAHYPPTSCGSLRAFAASRDTS
ncbi:MAG: hypothetical protein ACK5MS_11735, partial [Planctomyces sp.]